MHNFEAAADTFSSQESNNAMLNAIEELAEFPNNQTDSNLSNPKSKSLPSMEIFDSSKATGVNQDQIEQKQKVCLKDTGLNKQKSTENEEVKKQKQDSNILEGNPNTKCGEMRSTQDNKNQKPLEGITGPLSEGKIHPLLEGKTKPGHDPLDGLTGPLSEGFTPPFIDPEQDPFGKPQKPSDGEKIKPRFEQNKPTEKSPRNAAEDPEIRAALSKFFPEIAGEDSYISREELQEFIRDNQRYKKTGGLEHDPNSPVSESEYRALLRTLKVFDNSVDTSNDEWGPDSELSWNDLAPQNESTKRSRIPGPGTKHNLSKG